MDVEEQQGPPAALGVLPREGSSECLSLEAASDPHLLQRAALWGLRTPDAAHARVSLSPAGDGRRDDDVQLAGRCQAAEGKPGSGGDWFDAYRLSDGTAALVVGDVAGHGAAAAAAMVRLRRSFGILQMTPGVPASQLMSQVDTDFTDMGLDILATAFLGTLEADEGGCYVLRWCSAGHLPPVLVTAQGETTILDGEGDLLLGWGEETNRRDLSVQLPPESTLLIFTDGLVETRTAHLDEGIARLCAAAGPLAALNVIDLCDQLLPTMVSPHAVDDVTLLAVRIPASAA